MRDRDRQECCGPKKTEDGKKGENQRNRRRDTL